MFSFFQSKSKKQAAETGAEQYCYCPACGEEYRLGFSRCAVCDSELERRLRSAERSAAEGAIAGSPASRRVDVDISGEKNLVVASQGNLLELKRLKRLLAANGVPAVFAKDGEDCNQGCCGSPLLLLMVREADGATVRAVLQEDYQRLTSFDHQVSIQDKFVDENSAGYRCPACNAAMGNASSMCPDCGLCV